MKIYLPIVIVVMLIFSSIGIVIGEEEKSNMEKVSFSNISIKDEGQFCLVEFENTDVLMSPGKAIVPTYSKIFRFPFGTKISDVICTVSNLNEQVLDKDIMITPNPVLAGFADIATEEFINSDSIDINPYPGRWFDFDVGCGLNGAAREVIVNVQLYPVQYTLDNDLIIWAEEFDIEIIYEEPSQPTFFDDEYLLVVIGPYEFNSQIEPLIAHKNNMGVSAISVTLTEIYDGTYFPVQGRDSQEQIKYFIKNAIENWGTSYVLLVGGDYEVPVRITHVKATGGDSELFISDLYYADIYNESSQFCSWDSNENDVFGEYNWGSSQLTDEVDLYPDVYVGRLACISEDEVTTSVNKIIQYEVSEAYTSEWFTNLVACGGDSFPGDDNSIAEGEYVNDAVIDVMDGFIPTRLWATNGGLSGIPTGVTKITNAIEAGAGFVDFSGHGNPAVWATHPYEDDSKWLPTTTGGFWNTQISDLDNGDMLPIVVIGACSVSKFNDRPDCFTWSFISNPNGGGIGSFGATGLGWAYLGEWVIEGLIEGMAINTFEAYKDGATTLGEIWGKALTNYIYNNMEGTDYKTIEEWQLFGDPSLAVGAQSEAPAKPDTPDGIVDGKINVEYSYTSSATDPEGDKIYFLFDWGNGEFSGWLGPYNSGATVEGKYTWTEQGDYDIRVKAKDDHGVQSEWSDPLSASIPLSVPINNPFLRFLEQFPILWSILELLIK